MENLTGKQFGSYRISAPLGQGGMAAVYKAYQANMDRYVALKILPRHLANDPTFVGRFEQEAKVLARLQHPHILPVHDFGEADGYTYIVMPFVQSGTLTTLLQGKPLSLSQICRIITQIGDALDYAHSHHIIHRDVKPSNVLVDERGNCLLTDFGIAKIMEGTVQFTTTGGIIGTPAYMSPEQGLGEKVDHRSDIYALGVILYEMATGRVPYTAETPMAVMVKHIHDPLPLPHHLNPTLPEAVERIILKALAKQPADRYKTMRDMVQALQKGIPASTPLEGALDVKSDFLPSIEILKASDRAVLETTAVPTTQQQRFYRSRWVVGGAAIGGAIFILIILITLMLNSKGLSEAAETAMPLPEVTLGVSTVADIAAVIPNTPTVTPIPQGNASVDRTPGPLSTATIGIDSILYDNFNDAAFDGRFNTELWSIENASLDASQIVQQDGVLMLSDTKQSTSGGIGLGLRNWKMSSFDFFEVKLMLSSKGEGTASGNVTINAESYETYDIPGGWTELGIGYSSRSSRVQIHAKVNNPDIARLNAEYDTWYTVRLEFDKATNTFNYLVNEKLVATHALPATTLAKFRPAIQLWHDDGVSIKAFVDDVRIGLNRK